MEKEIWFESSVNSEGIETTVYTVCVSIKFESSVNSEGIETSYSYGIDISSLRAV